ncbi:MAG: IS630 family transposase [Planctomycetota bacterium]|nr:MAG: IS630 family transposase [Planctomycetota bacterium]
MRDYTLSNGKIAELEKLHRSLRDKRQADRVKAVLALSKGWSPAQVAEILLFDEKTSRHYFERYQQGGGQALLDDGYCGAEPKLNSHQLRKLERHLESHLLADAKSVIAYIKKQYNVNYSLSGVTDLLHRLGFSYKKPTHVPGKQDPAKQRVFLEEYEQIKATKGENDPIYFADATHPQHNSVPSYGWIKKGTEKELKANCGRQRLNINGAINIETLEPVTGFYDTINAQAAIHLFSKIQAKHPDADAIYIIIDNARYYRSCLLKESIEGTKLKLIFLPPYSPNLNLIERYWKFFKKKVLNNRYYETFDEFKQACKSFFRKRKKYVPELKTLLAENFHVQTA